MEVSSVCNPVLDGTAQVDMVLVHKDLDDMVPGHKIALADTALARKPQCGMVLGHRMVLGGRAQDLDGMVLVGRTHMMTPAHD